MGLSNPEDQLGRGSDLVTCQSPRLERLISHTTLFLLPVLLPRTFKIFLLQEETRNPPLR